MHHFFIAESMDTNPLTTFKNEIRATRDYYLKMCPHTGKTKPGVNKQLRSALRDMQQINGSVLRHSPETALAADMIIADAVAAIRAAYTVQLLS